MEGWDDHNELRMGWVIGQVLKTDVLSTQSTSEPDVVKGISESMGDLECLVEA